MAARKPWTNAGVIGCGSVLLTRAGAQGHNDGFEWQEERRIDSDEFDESKKSEKSERVE